jgi:hypothetical protein
MFIGYPELPLWQHPAFQHKDWLLFASQIQLADTSLTREQQRATLLQQALPQIPAAIYDCRDALLAQGAKLSGLIQTMVDGRLARVEGTLNCLVQSQLGAAQLLAEQLTSLGMEAVLQPGIQVSLTLRLQAGMY